MGIFIYASTATGKSSCGKKYKNVIDMESVPFKYVGENGKDESRKSAEGRTPNPEWPQNYFSALESVKEKYDYILISDSVCDSFLEKNGYEYWRIYPSKELKQEYLERCKSRGNNDEFIFWYGKLWQEWFDLCDNDLKASKKIKLKAGQYLEDVLPNLIIKSS